MESDIGALAPLVFCLLLTLLHFACTISEFSLLRSQSAILRRPEFEPRMGARCALKLIASPGQILMLLRVGALSAFAAFVYVIVSSQALGSILPFGLEGTTTWQRVAAMSGLLVGHFIVGVVLPTWLALRSPETTLMRAAPIMYAFATVFRPLLFVLQVISAAVARVFWLKTPESLDFVHSTEDIGRIFEGNSDIEEIDDEEQVMLRGVVEFSNTVAREVMTPRADLVCVPLDAALDDVVSIVTESGLSRFPVQGESIDDIKGIILARDILKVLSEAKLRETFKVSGHMRQAYFIPDKKPIDDLLNEFKRRKLHMAIVLDEHGGVDGVVTLEDLLEEIVGDIYDESDIPAEEIAVDSSGDVLVDGGMLVFELNEHFGYAFPEGDYDTIAGFVFTSLGRMPHIGDRIAISNGEIIVSTPNGSGVSQFNQDEVQDLESSEDSIVVIVEELDNNRISLVRIKSLETSGNAESKQSATAS